MSNFVTDNTTLSFPKTNRDPLAGGDDPTKFIAAPEWNAVCQAAYDLRGATPKYTSGDPNGVLAGAKGDIARDTANGAIWVNTTGGSVWKKAMIGDTAVTPGSYAPAAFTVDQQGRITAASNAPIGGRLLARQVLTATSGTYTPSSGTAFVKVWIMAPGGGGGGAQSTGGVAAGAGGSTGMLLHFTVGTPGGAAITGGAYACPAGGAGGVAGNNAGTNGGDATIVINGTTFTAKGGAGGPGMANVGAGANGESLPVAPAAGTSAVGDSAYAGGGKGVVNDGTAWSSGQGGSIPPWGSGGLPVGGGTAGANATGFGAGGGGAAATGSVNRAGGNGAPAKIVVEEYS